MIGFLGSAYLWVKAAHVIFVIFWMAGLFMLPRFFAYHQETDPASSENSLWIERERRLIAIILNPSMVAVWAFGLALLISSGAAVEHWFQAKFLVVLALSAYHGWLGGYAKRLAKGERRVSARTMRMLNEIPGIAVVIIVFLVVAKPF